MRSPKSWREGGSGGSASTRLSMRAEGGDAVLLGPLRTRIEVDRLEHGHERAQRVDLLCAGECAQARPLLRDVREAELLETQGLHGKSPVHVVFTVDGARRPQALGNRRRPRPEAGVDGARTHVLAPAARFAAQDARRLLRRQIAVGGQRIDAVMIRPRSACDRDNSRQTECRCIPVSLRRRASRIRATTAPSRLSADPGSAPHPSQSSSCRASSEWVTAAG